MKNGEFTSHQICTCCRAMRMIVFIGAGIVYYYCVRCDRDQ
jgi:hypothetical protein